MLDPTILDAAIQGAEVSWGIAPLLLAALIGGGAKAISSGLGQHNANKAAKAQDAEAARKAQQNYLYNQTRYNAAIERRTNTTNFIKAVAKQRGLDLPDEVWGLLSKAPSPFPAYSAPLPGHRPNALVSGLVGGVTGGLETYAGGLAKTPSAGGLTMPGAGSDALKIQQYLPGNTHRG